MAGEPVTCRGVGRAVTDARRNRTARRSVRRLLLVAGVLLGATSCRDSSLPPSSRSGEANVSTDDPGIDGTADVDSPRSGPGSEAVAVDTVVVDVDGTGIPIDRRLFGTNVPAWVGPERLADPSFRNATVESGTSLLRMPGGSWSNAYDWRACEVDDEAGCFWTWAARPTDFIDFIHATGIPGSWTVSFNDTAQAAAAAVAFFNGDVGDETVIGVDREGVNWLTVGTWARLRADHGNPDPARIELWEVGNEVYGAKSTAADGCASFGWEDVWTCDGAAYVDGDDAHDGFIEFRDAMRAVDPSIEVGAVGVGEPDAWGNWGNEVIDGAGGDLDVYVVHAYGFDSSPDGEAALRRPAELWPQVIDDVRDELDDDVPIAVTEYNLVSFESGDTEQSMTRSMNALFIADTIGRLARGGVAIANQWNLANGTTASGTDYGMISVDDGSRFPQFDALELWTRAGETLHGATVGDDDLAVYPTEHDDGRWTIVVVHLGDRAVVRTFDMGDMEPGAVSVSGVHTDDLTATSMDVTTEVTIEPTGSSFDIELPAWSISVIEIAR